MSVVVVFLCIEKGDVVYIYGDKKECVSEDVPVDINPPVCKVDCVGDNQYEGVKNFYGSNVQIEIDVSDEGGEVISGLEYVIITVETPDGVIHEDTSRIYGDELVLKDNFKVDTAKYSLLDGRYVICYEAKDNAGNSTGIMEKEIYKDTTEPKIEEFHFLTNGYQDVDEMEYCVEKQPYGYYFTQNTQLIITASDQDEISSGIKNITYYLVDEMGIVGKEHIINVDEKNQITVDIPKDFKGQIYAKTTDNVDNSSDFVTPHGIIVESGEKHCEEMHLSFVKENTETKDGNGHELYHQDTSIVVNAVDTYSGIRSIEWWVTAPYDTDKNQSGKVTINYDKTYKDGFSGEWEQIRSEDNLVMEMRRTFVISHNSNDIILKVRLTDRAGNITEQETMISIDKTTPSYSVMYDNNVSANDNDNIFRDNRMATITVVERNFNPENVKMTMVNSENVIPRLSDWTEYKDLNEPDNTTYVATILYDTDGEYSFHISVRDMAGNVAEDYQTDKFIIDKTLPVIEFIENHNGIPNVRFEDCHYCPATTEIHLVGTNTGKRSLSGRFEDFENGQMYIFEEFPMIKENDDVYTITATTQDRAGNKVSKSTIFTVNQFGSVYNINEEIASLNHQYIHTMEDVIITEKNVNQLAADKIAVRITKNGIPTDLVYGRDYTVQQSGGDGQWNSYVYHINKELFQEDGAYRIQLYSVDDAGNINESNEISKEAEIAFGIDTLEPVIVPLNIESGEIYLTDTKRVIFNIKDNLLLDSVEIYLNNKPVEFTVNQDMYSFVMQSADEEQNIRVIAIDAAGNRNELKIENVMITMNSVIKRYPHRRIIFILVNILLIFGLLIVIGVQLNKRRKRIR